MNGKKAKALRREAKKALGEGARPIERRLYQTAKRVYKGKRNA